MASSNGCKIANGSVLCTQKNGEALNLYSGVSQDNLAIKANKYLAHYGPTIHPEVIVGAHGSYIYAASGHKVLDWTSGQMSCLQEHGHPAVVDVITKHAMHLDHLFSDMVSPPVVNLVERLCDALPARLDKAFFPSTGGESNEAAIKTAKTFTGKFEIVALGASWHGMTAQAIGTQYHYGRKWHGPLMPGMHMLPAPNSYLSRFRHPDGSYDWESELDYGSQMVDTQSCGSLAACIIECIQSSGVVHILPEGYTKALKKRCETRGMLLIVDEAQTGVGRAGSFTAFQQHDIVPHILKLPETLGNGLPFRAVVTSSEVTASAQPGTIPLLRRTPMVPYQQPWETRF